MTTWGPSGKKPSKKSSGKRSTRVDPASRTAKTSRTSRSTGRSSVRDATPEQLERSTGAGGDHRAPGRHNDELIGLGLIGAAVLLGLAIYVDLAGPIGRGVETMFGWFFGLGRYAVPLVLGAVGVAFVRKGRSSGPVRLAIAWTVVVVAALGLVHVVRRDDERRRLRSLRRLGRLDRRGDRPSRSPPASRPPAPWSCSSRSSSAA